MIDYKTARKSMERRPYSLQGLSTSRENLTPAVHAFKELILRKKIDRLPFSPPEPVLSWLVALGTRMTVCSLILRLRLRECLIVSKNKLK